MTRPRRAACAAALWAVAWLAPGAAAAQGPAPASRLDLERPIGWLGIQIRDVDEQLADQLAARFGPAAGIGVLVMEAMPGTPAAAAGLLRNDVIVALDGQPIWDVRQLQRRVRSAPVGTTLTVVVLRARGQVPVPVRVGPMPDETLATVLGEALGFVVQERREEGTPGGARRPRSDGQVVVTEVDPRSPARVAGLRPRDIVVEVDGRPVTGLKELYSALRAAATKPAFPVAVDRQGTRLVLTLAPGSAPPSP